MPPTPNTTLVQLFQGWNFLRAVLHNGWWLVVSLYMVVDAHLSPAQLLIIAAAQGVVSVIFEIPAGVLADTISRKWALVVSHVLMAIAMIATGLTEGFVTLMLAQMLWGISWTFASGSDVAWATDELGQPDQMHLVLAAQSRWQMIGAGVGIVTIGGLAAGVGRPTAIILAGVAMLALGIGFAALFPERHFVRVRHDHVRAALDVARRGAQLAISDRTLLILLVVTILVSGAGDSFARIYPVQLTHLGFPPGDSGTAWFTALGLSGYAIAVLALVIAQRRLHSDQGSRITTAAACTVGMGSLLLLGSAANLQVAIIGVLLLTGIAMPVVRTATTIWVNRRTTSDIRATTHSFLAQAEYVGEIGCAAGLAVLANSTEPDGAIVVTGVLFGLAAVIVLLGQHIPPLTSRQRK